MDRGRERGRATGKELDAILDAVDSAGGGEFAQGDGQRWVEAALVDPGLECVEVDFGEVDGMAGNLMFRAMPRRKQTELAV